MTLLVVLESTLPLFLLVLQNVAQRGACIGVGGFSGLAVSVMTANLI